MDSKYAFFDKNGSNGSNLANGKRKFVYGSMSGTPQAKKPTIQHVTKPIASPSQAASTSTSNSNNSTINKKPVNNDKSVEKLPIIGVRNELMKYIHKCPALIVLSETGSGKSTQIPQFIYKSGLADAGAIAITQPRRVAAISIATRVANEMKVALGDLVGYTVRFENNSTKKTKLRFMTDGSLLREALIDKMLSSYSVIILDEAHERTINTDVLFGIVKKAEKKRRVANMAPLKIIIMSATMDVDHFSKYFNNCKVVFVEGRTYPIRIMHTTKQHDDYMHACLSTVFKIHQEAPPTHDILVFLTGQEEIEIMSQQIKFIAKSNSLKGPVVRVFPLYAQLPQSRQMDVFLSMAPNTRKIILSTNIAETSLTIPGIKYVIDSGVVKRRVYDSINGMETLKVVRISKDQAWQRCGRAGRESDGFCYRAYTQATFDKMSESTTPEIKRSNISTTILQLLAIGIDGRKFDFIDRPDEEAMDIAIRHLNMLGAISIDGKTIDLTPSGQQMAKFPLDPRYSKMLLAAPSFGCLEEMLTIVALLSGEDIFINNIFDVERRGDALVARARFESQYGDHLTMLNVFRAYTKVDRIKTWCHENYLNNRNLSYATDVRVQLSAICKRLDLKVESCGKNLDQVRKCLLTGLFMNVAELQSENHYLTLSNRHRAKIHPSSTLSGKPVAKYILFSELVKTEKTMMRYVTQIEADWIEEFVPKQMKRLLAKSPATTDI